MHIYLRATFFSFSLYVFCVPVPTVSLLSRGSDFRPAYQKVAELRSVFSVPFLFLSATVNQKILDDLVSTFSLTSYSLVHLLPDRRNIYLQVVDQRNFDFEQDLMWLVEDVKRNGMNTIKTLVFADSIKNVSSIFQFLKVSCKPVSFQTNIISMFHAEIGTSLRSFILQSFTNVDSEVRVLVCSIAFGMGIEVKDVGRVIHWGKNKSIMNYWQEVGRAGRDGGRAKAIWYAKGVGTGVDKDVFLKMKKDKSVCIRATILNHFVLDGKTDFDEKKNECPVRNCSECMCDFCSCCSNCSPKCPCSQ